MKQVEALALGTDCIDKEVITEILDFGINFTNDYESSSFAVSLLGFIVIKETNIQKEYQPNDSRVAFAIRAGLIEMCLSFIERFLVEDISQQLDKYLSAILGCVHDISLHQKSAKAIRSKRSTIEEKLVRLEQQPSITNNVKCKELIDMVRSILNLNGAYCCRCNKTLGRKDIKRCNGCNRMTYCSKACQREDWLNGHNLTCCNKHYTDEQAGVFQGRHWPLREPESERAAAKLEALEQNVSMVQLKLFLANAGIILNQASHLGIPLYDCIVQFDLNYCPPTVVTMNYTEYFVSSKSVKSFEESRSKENITCVYISNIYNGELDGLESIPKLSMQKLFPCEYLLKESL